MYNVLGYLVLSSTNAIVINVPTRKTGIYFVKFKLEGKEVIKQIVKE